MKLTEALNLQPTEALYASGIILTEDGEGPRLRFGYPNFKHDPTPDVLMLGNYDHPNTGNELIGGINLNYLDKHQMDDLAKALPKILEPSNLYGRYWAGRRLVPDVFKNFYRTYNNDYIRNPKKDIMKPKKSLRQATADWLKQKVQALLKTKKQREIDKLPKFPNDLSNLQQRLDRIVSPDVPPEQPQPDEDPVMKRARDVFVQHKLEKERLTAVSEPSPEDEALAQAKQELPTDHSHDIEKPGTGDTKEMDMAKRNVEQQREIKRSIEGDKKENEAEMKRGEDRNLGDMDLEDLEESIIYYSPIRGRYVAEPLPV